MTPQNPAAASSSALSSSSNTRWCNPCSVVEPMYIEGFRRTASTPGTTTIELAS